MLEPATSHRSIEVGLIADLACPWCYLGLARLERARAMRPEKPVRLRWQPFFLNPELPPEGMDRQTYLRVKFGGEAAARRVYERIVESGLADGVDFAFDRMRRTPNTMLAHRLILLAEERGAGETFIGALFRALFIEGRDIGDPQQLIELGADAGLERNEVDEFLAGERHRKAVLASHRQAERLGVRGVPVFVVGGEYVIAGAQPAEVLAGLLDLAMASREEPGPARAQRSPARAAPTGA
jgi:predicted DsbA family dithiol-disulfide isomerase